MATARLKAVYKDEARVKLQEEFKYSNVMQIPRVEKVIINFGMGEAAREPKLIDGAIREITAITGRKPIVTLARKSIAAFKLREGMKIGAKVTLRRDAMWEFMERLIYVALPRVRDFRGVGNKGFDGRGNYTLGIKEQIIFPEIDYDQVDKVNGLNVTFVTDANTDEECLKLLAHLGMPFKK
jgi:large subunit ribosomal protein L5